MLRLARLDEAREQLADRPLAPMTPEEIQAETTPTVPSSDVRVVLDTNTALSGLIWGGPPGHSLMRPGTGTSDRARPGRTLGGSLVGW